jgi:hypothetical protein
LRFLDNCFIIPSTKLHHDVELQLCWTRSSRSRASSELRASQTTD